MRRKQMTMFGASVVLVGMLAFGCSDNAPVSPSTTPPTGGGGGGGGAAVTIAIVGMNGVQSFAPNPASVVGGQSVRWLNNDTTVHRIVQDGGGFDTGDLAPGAASAAISITGSDAIDYHCSLHPEMVGTLTVRSITGPY